MRIAVLANLLQVLGAVLAIAGAALQWGLSVALLVASVACILFGVIIEPPATSDDTKPERAAG